MIELLVVVAIIAILASLLLPALSSAKEKGRTARCVANVRQMALGLMLYLDDFHRYPPLRYQIADGTTNSWYDSLAGSLGKWTNSQSVFKCPSFKYNQTDKLWDSNQKLITGIGSYGYNALSAFSLATDQTIDPRLKGLQLKESAVKVPASMIAFGDSYLVQWPATKMILGTIDFQYVPISYRSKLATYPAEMKAVRERHGGRHVTAFCDGHVETIKFETLFADDAATRRMWNYDFQAYLTPYD